MLIHWNLNRQHPWACASFLHSTQDHKVATRYEHGDRSAALLKPGERWSQSLSRKKCQWSEHGTTPAESLKTLNLPHQGLPHDTHSMQCLGRFGKSRDLARSHIRPVIQARLEFQSLNTHPELQMLVYIGFLFWPSRLMLNVAPWWTWLYIYME